MKKKQTLSTVISCNPYNDSYYTGTSTSIEKAKKPKFLKTQHAMSALRTKSFLSAKIQISKNIDEEDRTDVIENKAYEELGLDMATEYKISFYEVPEEQDEANLVFNVFVVDPHDFKEEFAPVIDKIRYIDHIYPVPLLMRALYKKEIIRDEGIDCFIYFSDHDAFLTLYKDGEFLYTKELKFTLSEIHELFCEIYGERVTFENFLTLFTEEGLRTTNAENKEFLIKLFNEMFTQINDVINFAKRAYEIEEINKLYIGSSAGVIFGMDEFAQTILGIKTLNFDFEYGLEVNEFYVDQIHQLLHLNAQLVADDRYELNFTIFDRPPPFVKRESGKIILLAAGTLLVSSIYPLWNVGYTTFTQLESASLKKEKRQIHTERMGRQSQMEGQARIKAELDKKIKAESALLAVQNNVLTQIHDRKVKYPMKAKIISTLTKDLNKYKVHLSSIAYEDGLNAKDGHFTLEMVSGSEKRMTDMIEKLTKDNLKNYRIALEEIAYDTEASIYKSSLKVELR
jgi:hypothetical protein